MTWKPIQTVPTGNIRVLLWVANGYSHGHVKTGVVDPENHPQAVYSFFDDGECVGMLPELFATHWMPLPNPPEEK